MSLTGDPAKLAAVRANVFPAAHALVSDWDAFPWHENRRAGVDADVPWSSQAFCMSVWGTVAARGADEVRAVVGRACNDDVIARALETSRPRVEVEVVNPDLLNERGSGNPSNLDAVLEFDALVVVVESKLSEPFGHCSQATGRHCSGVYGSGSDLKHRTDAPCRLQVPDGRRTARTYWDVMNVLAGGTFAAPGSPCPFRGGGYQVMRTIASAARLGQIRGKDWRAVFAFPSSLGGPTRADITDVRARLLAEHQRRVTFLDYETVCAALAGGQFTLTRSLGDHMATRLAAARTKNSLPPSKRPG